MIAGATHAGAEEPEAPQPSFAAAPSVPQALLGSSGSRQCGSAAADRARGAEEAAIEARKQAALQHIRSQGGLPLCHLQHVIAKILDEEDALKDVMRGLLTVPAYVDWDVQGAWSQQ